MNLMPGVPQQRLGSLASFGVKPNPHVQGQGAPLPLGSQPVFHLSA